jgi:MFS family permease
MRSGAALGSRSALRPLRHRDFRLLWTGLVVSNVGTWMQFVAVGYLVDRLTLSPLYLGLLALAQAVPRFVFAPVGGALADRWDRKALLFWTNAWLAASALVLAGLTLGGWIRVWHVLALAAVNSALQSFDMPARHSWIPSLVDSDEVLQAVTLNSVAFNGAGIVGPSLGGLVIAWAGEAGCFLLNALSYAAVVAALRRMAAPPPPVPAQASVLAEVGEAVTLLRRNRTVAWVLGTVAAVNFLGRPYFRLMPAFAREVLHADAVGLGLLQAAPGLGTLLSPWYVAVGQTRGQGWLLARSALGLGVCVTLFALSPAFGWAFGFLVAAGLFQSAALSSANALVQTAVEPGMRGRAMGLYSVTAFGMFTLGSFPFGALAEATGTSSALAAGGLLTVLLALGVGPRLRRLVDEGEGGR